MCVYICDLFVNSVNKTKVKLCVCVYEDEQDKG